MKNKKKYEKLLDNAFKSYFKHIHINKAEKYRDMYGMKTEEDIYADQQTTLQEAIAIVVGKRAAGIPLSGVREELADKLITEWVGTFGVDG